MARKDQNEIPTDQWTQDARPAERTMAGVVMQAAGHKFVIPTAKLTGAILLVCGLAWNVASAQASSFLDRIKSIEETAKAQAKVLDLHDRKIEAQDVTQARILADTTEIKARLAEVQVTLMREAHR